MLELARFTEVVRGSNKRTRSTSCSAAVPGGRAGLESRWGAGDRLAHRMLGDCAARPRRDLDVHGGGRDLASRTTSAKRPDESVSERLRAALDARRTGRLDGTKMSKSSQPGLRRRVGPAREAAAVRLALLDHHYRRDWDGAMSCFHGAVATRDVRSTLTYGRPSSVVEDVARLDDDLDSPRHCARSTTPRTRATTSPRYLVGRH